MARRHLALAAVVLAAGCSREAGTVGTTTYADSVPRRAGAAPGAAWAIQLASLVDSAGAARLRDSLAWAGWNPVVARVTVEHVPRWRVLVLPTRDQAQAALVGAALRAEGRDALVVALRTPVADRAVLDSRVVPVNTRTHGMAAQVRWAFSPDGKAMLVVEDPLAVEADPVPDGFVLADERSGALWQCDGVWDVTPSPDWRALAYSRAWVADGGRDERIPLARWTRLATGAPMWLRRDVTAGDSSPAALGRSLAAASFPVSGMSYARGAAVTVVAEVKALARGDSGCAAPGQRGVGLGGWRLGWLPAGDTLAIGAPPDAVRDDAPSPRFVLVEPRPGGDSLGTAAAARLAVVHWVEGPTLDISVAVDLREPLAIRAGLRRITSEGGWIRVASPDYPGPPRVVGPGRPLAATADGRFVAALAPQTDAPPHESPTILVVYQVP